MPLGSLLDLAGGFLSSRSNRREGRRNRQMAQAQFDAQMDSSISRRVADARRAGVHPLFALGASVGASPTLTHSGGGPTGSAVGDAVSRLGQRLAQAQIRGANAEAGKSEAEAALANAKTAVVTSALASRGRDALGNTATTYQWPDMPKMNLGMGPGWTEVPREIPAAGVNPGVQAGAKAGTEDVVLPSGRIYRTLAEGMGDEVRDVQMAVMLGMDKTMTGISKVKKALRGNSRLPKGLTRRELNRLRARRNQAYNRGRPRGRGYTNRR